MHCIVLSYFVQNVREIKFKIIDFVFQANFSVKLNGPSVNNKIEKLTMDMNELQRRKAEGKQVSARGMYVYVQCAFVFLPQTRSGLIGSKK